jgi:membrane protein DedA with SNARE-associated domain
MFDPGQLLERWSYAGIFFAVALGNVGVPVPEETILAVAGYAVWSGQLRFTLVVLVGVVSAVAGDNIGYWIGRRYGRVAILRFVHWTLITPQRLGRLCDLMARYGALTVFAARFVPGLRFLAGPLAGTLGLPPLTFAIANLLGALVYVPYAVGLGYAIGWGFGDVLRHVFGHVEHIVVPALVLLTLLLLAWRIFRIRVGVRL